MRSCTILKTAFKDIVILHAAERHCRCRLAGMHEIFYHSQDNF